MKVYWLSRAGVKMNDNWIVDVVAQMIIASVLTMSAIGLLVCCVA